MITKTLILCLAAGFLTFGQPARAARHPFNASGNNASFEARRQARQTHRPATISEQTVSGVIPRAIRGGNPLQMFNPLAPRKYGTAEENVSLDPDVPGKGSGVNLLSIAF
jgi:hypothetical protein